MAVDDVPDPQIQEPTDALIRITTTNICGSDLHMYEGRTSVEEGKILGHENMGPYDGGQAEYLRVPVADFNLLASIDLSQGDPVEAIVEANGGHQVDRGVEAVGYQRSTGAIGVVGVYMPEGPGAATDAAKEGRTKVLLHPTA